MIVCIDTRMLLWMTALYADFSDCEKPFKCMILICFAIVLFPDSPVPTLQLEQKRESGRMGGRKEREGQGTGGEGRGGKEGESTQK